MECDNNSTYTPEVGVEKSDFWRPKCNQWGDAVTLRNHSLISLSLFLSIFISIHTCYPLTLLLKTTTGGQNRFQRQEIYLRGTYCYYYTGVYCNI